MTLWIVMAVLAAAACLPLLAPLYRGGPAAAPARQAMAIYRDQLGEIDRDVERGVIAEGEAVAARTEIARRLLHEDDIGATPPPTSGRARAIAAVAIVAAPIAALGLYLVLGSPEYPDRPLAARMSDNTDVAALIAKVEAHLAASPDDGKGWELLAPIYVKMGRYDDGIRAYGNVIRTLGDTAGREGDLGEAIVAASGGALTKDARAAFQKAHDLDPADPRPRFYLAMALAADGKNAEAIAAWHALLADAPPGAPWAPAARVQLAALQAPGGPTAGDVAAAANLAPDQRLAMIEGMVSSLASKLAADPNDAEGWARLVRSYMVLNRPEDARAALASATKAFADDPDKRATIEAAAREAGLNVEAQ